MNLWNKIKKYDYLLVTVSTVIGAMIGFVYSIYSRKFIDPLEYGIFSTCLLLQNYMCYAQFGVLSSYNRDYPQLLSASNAEGAKKLRDTTLSYLLTVYFVSFTIIAAVLMLWHIYEPIDNRYGLGFILIGLILIISNVESFCTYTTRMTGLNNYSALVELAKNIFAIILGLLGIYYIGYFGLYFKLLSAPIIAIFLYYKTSLKGFKFAIDKEVLYNSVKTGLPLMISSFIYTIMASVDKFVILKYMDTYQLGIYSVPLIGFNTILLIPQTISQLFYYKISRTYGETNSADALLDVGIKYTKLLSFYTSIVVVAAFYTLPIFVDYFMAKYTEGVYPAQILMIGVGFYASSMLFSNVFSVLKWNKILLFTSTLLCLFNIVFSVAMVWFKGAYIENVALGTSISYGISSLLTLTILSRKLNKNIKILFASSYSYVAQIILPCMLLNYFSSSTIYAACISCGIILSIAFINKSWRLHR